MHRAGPNPRDVGIDTSIPPEDRYDIVGRIASGGMAEIYLARMRMRQSNREVALKRLLPELQADQEFVQMFYDEANIASKLSHPNIVQIFELGELDESLFISMELLRGVNLRDLLARLTSQNETLPIPIALRIASECLAALDYAHRFVDENGRPLNVVHRDVSPQNIIVTFDGSVKLVDFGVAKAEGRLHQTRAGLIKGKFAYMSPEQVSGEKVDGRSDLFALAEVFYELLLQRHPFYAATDMDVLRAILDKDPPHPCSIDSAFPPALGEIFTRALKKAPGARFRSAADMQDAIERFLQSARTPANTGMLARYVADLFSDRVERERAARASGDEESLIDALAAGEPETPVAPKRNSSARALARIEARIPGDESGPRDRVIEINSQSQPYDDPSERSAPAFLAHSGYSSSPVERRFESQVRNLFDDEPEPSDDLEYTDSTGKTQVVPEADEMPTMLGSLSDHEMEEIRRATRARRKSSHGIRIKPIDPDPLPTPIVPAPRPNPTPAPRLQQHTPQGPGVTHRSRTVLGAEDQKKRRKRRKDRTGLAFFIVSLVALALAIAFAVWIYQDSAVDTGELVIRSSPPGAAIILDGENTDTSTPQLFGRVPANRPHEIELQLPGYQTCKTTATVLANQRIEVPCKLKKVP